MSNEAPRRHPMKNVYQVKYEAITGYERTLYYTSQKKALTAIEGVLDRSSHFTLHRRGDDYVAYLRVENNLGYSMMDIHILLVKKIEVR
jgi:hypothetical protein